MEKEIKTILSFFSGSNPSERITKSKDGLIRKFSLVLTFGPMKNKNLNDNFLFTNIKHLLSKEALKIR